MEFEYFAKSHGIFDLQFDGDGVEDFKKYFGEVIGSDIGNSIDAILMGDPFIY